MKPLSVWTYFQDLKEPRVERTRRHKRMDIVVIRVMAMIGHGDGWDEVLERLPAALQAIRSACRRFVRLAGDCSAPTRVRRDTSRANPKTLFSGPKKVGK
jgi:hypothetical protein